MKDRDLEVSNKWTIEVHHHNFAIHIVNIKSLAAPGFEPGNCKYFWQIGKY